MEGYGILTYPGALFPNNFAEVEKYYHGGYYLITTDLITTENNLKDNLNDYSQTVDWIPLKVIEHHAMTLNCNHKSPAAATSQIMEQSDNSKIKDALVTLRLAGKLIGGKVSDINFKQILTQLYSQGAYLVMKNTASMQSEEFEEIKISAGNPETMEEEIIKEHLQQHKLFNPETEMHITKTLLQTLNTVKKKGRPLQISRRKLSKKLRKYFICSGT